jgi:hypothetical protein
MPKIKGNGFILFDKKNLIHNKKCRFCNKKSEYYRYKLNDYVCKEHLFND